jgi:hypothetical protein
VTEQPRVQQDVIDALELVFRAHIDVELSLLKARHAAGSPFRDLQRATRTPMPFGGCYQASWGWVHVRPGCRCPRG